MILQRTHNHRALEALTAEADRSDNPASRPERASASDAPGVTTPDPNEEVAAAAAVGLYVAVEAPHEQLDVRRVDAGQSALDERLFVLQRKLVAARIKLGEYLARERVAVYVSVRRQVCKPRLSVRPDDKLFVIGEQRPCTYAQQWHTRTQSVLTERAGLGSRLSKLESN